LGTSRKIRDESRQKKLNQTTMKRVKLYALICALVLISGTVIILNQSCNKEKTVSSVITENPHSAQRHDVVSVISKIHSADVCTNASDSICTITIYYNDDGTAEYSYVFGVASAASKWETYSLDTVFTFNGDTTEAELNISGVNTYYAIPFDNPSAPELMRDISYTFTCECCNNSNNVCVFRARTVNCTNTSCSGKCGLNANRFATNSTYCIVMAKSLSPH
jgi:hypothetical protein